MTLPNLIAAFGGAKAFGLACGYVEGRGWRPAAAGGTIKIEKRIPPCRFNNLLAAAQSREITLTREMLEAINAQRANARAELAIARTRARRLVGAKTINATTVRARLTPTHSTAVDRFHAVSIASTSIGEPRPWQANRS